MEQNNNRIPIGNTIRLRWRIKTNHEVVDLEGRDLALELINPKGQAKNLAFTIASTNVIVFVLEGKDQKNLRTGTYMLNLWENQGKVSQARVDRIAFELVEHTDQARLDATDNLEIVQDIDLGESDLAILYGTPYIENGTWHVEGRDLGIPAYLVPRFDSETREIVYEL